MVGKYFDFENVRMVDCVIEVELKKDNARSIKKRLHQLSLESVAGYFSYLFNCHTSLNLSFFNIKCSSGD